MRKRSTALISRDEVKHRTVGMASVVYCILNQGMVSIWLRGSREERDGSTESDSAVDGEGFVAKKEREKGYYHG